MVHSTNSADAGAVASGAGERGITVECRGVTKKYGSHAALDGIDLTLYEGEFIALLGPNGAGKSTFIKVLDGVVVPDSGELRFGGGEFPVSAGVIHQDLGLFDDMSVAENLFLAREGSRSLISMTGEQRDAVDLLDFVGLTAVDPRALIRDLTLGERALVATARLWSRGSGVIIVDEVTASLPRTEAFWLIEHLKGAARSGATVVMVTHRLEEVLGHVDRYIMLVDGRLALDAPADGIGRDHLTSLMASGRNTDVSANRDISERPPGDIVVELDNATVGILGPLNLQLRAGVITGLSGSSVSGFHDAAYLAAGVARAKRGSVRLKPGSTVTCLPAHRDVDGVFPDQTVEFNMASGNWRGGGELGLINFVAMRGDTRAAAEELNVVPCDTNSVITTLSGGNQQKALLGRVVADNPHCVVLCEPTRGVDVATRQEIYTFVRKLADDGCAVLVASSDMEDLASLADRIGVIDDDGGLETWVETDAVAEFCSSRTAQG